METFIGQHLPTAHASRPRRTTVPAAGGPASSRRRRRLARVAVVAVATAALTGAGVTKRSLLAASVAVLGHAQWIWVPAAVLLELASLAALAGMQRRLLLAGGASVGVRPMLATTFAANAVSVSVPMAGPELGTLFTFRRLTWQGADATLASWSLVAGGLVSTATGALIVAGGGLSSGNTVALAAAAPAGMLAAAALAVVAMAAHRPRLRRVLEQSAVWAVRRAGRALRRRTDDPGRTVRVWADRLGSLRLPASGWAAVTGLALVNWLSDAAVLAIAIHATGAAVPWHVLLLVYGSGVAAQSLTITPGGFGVAEGTLGLTLVAAGLRPGGALAAVLLYRLVSFWLVASTGWLVFLWLRRLGRLEGGVRHRPDLPARAEAGPQRVRGSCRGGHFRPRSVSAASIACRSPAGLSSRSRSIPRRLVRSTKPLTGP